MSTPQSTGNCAACHTAKGVNGAPGRIIIPGG
jgi:mono/diheme cytochrome c family protein